MAAKLNIVGAEPAPKAQKTKMDTLLLTQEVVNQWRIPPFQRPLRVNEKVLALAQVIANDGGMVPGVLTLGQVAKDHATYVVDGQHRIEAFRISALAEGMADVRICTFESMGAMAAEFVALNSNLVNMRPDDVLRGLEGSMRPLAYIRESCDFVGYDNIRRGSGGASAAVSMSALVRAWNTAHTESGTHSGGVSAAVLGEQLTEHSAKELVVFLQIARAAWGGDPEYYRLWSALNLTMCMWLWRRLVVDKDRGVKRFVVLTPEQFKKCLMSVSASRDYVDWLQGRQVSQRDRSPCYNRLKAIFTARLREDSKTEARILLPQPAWAS